MEPDLSQKTFGIMNVPVFRGNVKIAAPDQFFIVRILFFKEGVKKAKPSQLLGEGFRIRRPALGDIGIHHGPSPVSNPDHPAFILTVTETIPHILRLLKAKDGNTVIRFLSPVYRDITQFTDLINREIPVLGLCFLEAQQIRFFPAPVKPPSEDRHTCPNGIYVKARDDHQVLRPARGLYTYSIV
jgi:hypothetical protein